MNNAKRDRSTGTGVGSGLTVAAVVAAVVCCATPILIGAGLVTSPGVLFRNAGIIGIGLALIGWPVFRAIRRLGSRQIGPVDLDGRDAAKHSAHEATTTGRLHEPQD